ncbi:MAG: cobalamin-dependent protein [Phycisphaerae bacterium]|nr:cobalamin-dependent protein [Phycisphaerae bacterium]
MNVALINPNRFRNPPTIPVGLEYLAHAMRQAGHGVRLLDLCFVEDVGPAVDAFLAEQRPDVAMLSLRNVDSVINAADHFFLDEHRAIAERITAAGVPLIVGGAGVVAMPEPIRVYLGADTVIVGPGEGAAVELLAAMAAGKPLPPLADGFGVAIDAVAVPARAVDVDYAAYYAADGVAGVASSYGCPCRCAFCIEARTRLVARAPEAVAAEVRSLVEQGWARFHLCDAEMNVTYAHALALCQALVGSGASWITYMRHQPCDPVLAAAMRASGCTMATVTVNSATDAPADAAATVAMLKAEGIQVAVDLSCGLPGETPEQAKAMIDALDVARPGHVGVTTRYRIYPTTPLAERIRADAAEHRFATGDPEFVRPAAYCRFDPAEVRTWLEGREGFAIDTGEAVNYQRLNKGGRSQKPEGRSR